MIIGNFYNHKKTIFILNEYGLLMVAIIVII
jgi:hypothetical protein